MHPKSNGNGSQPPGMPPPGVDAANGGSPDGGGTPNDSGMPNDGGTTVNGYKFVTFDGPGMHAGGTTVNGISSAGVIVGFAANKAGTKLFNFLRNPDGSLTTIAVQSPTATANAVNKTDVVVGATGANAFVYTNMVETTLAAASPGDTTAEIAFGINDSGAIVGQYTKVDGSSPGFLLVNNTFTSIAPPNAQATNAQGINNNGLVIGFFATAAALAGPIVAGNPAQHGFLFDSASSTYSMLPDPDVPGLFLTQYLSINDTNQAVGYWQDTAGNQHGFIYDRTAMAIKLLDAPDAKPVAGISITQIVGIDHAGNIAGFFVDAAGMQHGFYASPQ
jgi:hypothetical protein